MKPKSAKTWSRELATIFIIWLLAAATWVIVTGPPETGAGIISTLAFPLFATWTAVFGIDKAMKGGWLGNKPDPPVDDPGAQP